MAAHRLGTAALDDQFSFSPISSFYPPDWHERQIREDSNVPLPPGPYNGPPYRADGARHEELPAGGGPAGRDELLAAGVFQPGDAGGTAGRKQPAGLMSLDLRNMDSDAMETSCYRF